MFIRSKKTNRVCGIVYTLGPGPDILFAIRLDGEKGMFKREYVYIDNSPEAEKEFRRNLVFCI